MFLARATVSSDSAGLKPAAVICEILKEDGELARRPELGLRMLGSMSQHLRVLVSLIEDMTLKDVETRFINWLMKQVPVGAREFSVELSFAKRVLAAELGTSSESLSRTFARLRDDGLLTVKGKKLHLRDVPALQARFRRLLGET